MSIGLFLTKYLNCAILQKTTPMKTKKIPRYICLTGQSGVGKSTFVKFLLEFLQSIGESVYHINTGDVMARYSNGNSRFAPIVKESYINAKLQPNALVISACFQEIEKNTTENQIIIHEGMPRQPGQFPLLKQLCDFNRLGPIGVIEIVASEKKCRERLVERTKKSGRIDLSVKGKAGVPSMHKINRKMNWWSINRDTIIGEIPSSDLYTICNEGTISELLQQPQKAFF